MNILTGCPLVYDHTTLELTTRRKQFCFIATASRGDGTAHIWYKTERSVAKGWNQYDCHNFIRRYRHHYHGRHNYFLLSFLLWHFRSFWCCLSYLTLPFYHFNPFVLLVILLQNSLIWEDSLSIIKKKPTMRFILNRLKISNPNHRTMRCTTLFNFLTFYSHFSCLFFSTVFNESTPPCPL